MHIFAFGTSDSCLETIVLFGSFFAVSLSFLIILFFISAAAAFVNVSTSSLSISTGLFSSVILLIIRSTRTAVLPEPAAALTRIFEFLASIAFCCASFHCGID